MFKTLQQVLNNGGGTPSQIVAAMRQAMLAVYASQVLLVVVTAVLIRLFLPARQTHWAALFAGVAIILYLAVVATVQATMRQTDLASTLRSSIFLGAIASIPALFAFTLFALEGFSNGFFALLALAGLLLAITSFQVAALALQVPKKILSVEPVAWPFGLGELRREVGLSDFRTSDFGQSRED